MDAQGIAAADQHVEFLADMRYRGQGYEIPVPWGEDLEERFNELHEQLYGFRMPDTASEIVNLRAVGTGDRPEPGAAGGRAARRAASSPGTLRARPTSTRARSIAGPSIVTEFDSTTVVLEGYTAEVDRYFNLLIRKAVMRDPKVAEIPDLEVDPITLDIIENALRHARFEMDAVLFRSAMSPGDPRAARRVPDAHRPAGPDGRRPVRRLHQRDDGRLGPRHLPGRRDPHERPVQVQRLDLAHQRLARAGADLLRGRARRLVLASSATRWTPAAACRAPCPTGATTIFEEGIIIPPLKIVERGEVQEDVLRLILNNVRLPEMNRADLFAIVAACHAGEKRVMELCERFGKDVYLATLQALLDRTHEAMRKLIQLAIPEEPQTFEDWIDDDGLGNGPYKMKLTIWREGEEAWFDWSGTDPQSLGPINFYLSEGMFKMFIGVYLIMVNDPDILFNDGFYPLLHVVMPEGCLLSPRHPAALGCRTHGLARLFDVLGGALTKQAPELNTAAGYGTSPYMLYSGWKDDGEFFYAMEILYGGIPGRPIGDGMDGHSWWPLFENIPTEYLEAYYPLRVDGYTTVTDSGGAGLPPRRQRGREALRVPRAGARVDPRRPLADAAVGRARRPAGGALDEDPAPRRRDRGGAAGQVRRGRGRAGRHADLPDRRRRRLEGPAGPAGRGGRARRGVRARERGEGEVRATAW